MVRAIKRQLVMIFQDVALAVVILIRKKLEFFLTFVALVVFAVFISVVAIVATTKDIPDVSINRDYLGLAIYRLSAAAPRDFAAVALETMVFYLDYPPVWFTFERMTLEEQRSVLAMDTTVAFPLSIRSLAGVGPIPLLLAVYVVLSRHRARGLRAAQNRGCACLLSVSVPGGSSAVGGALAPMACCGGTVVSSVTSLMGLTITAPAAILLSKISVIGVALLLIVGILRLARKIAVESSLLTTHYAR